MMPMKHAALVVFALASACRPSGVGEAERNEDVRFLSQSGSPEAVAALGRLADSKPAALAALDARAASDVNVYIAAWDATLRGAPWGPTRLRQGLALADRAELAARAMKRADPHLDAFVLDLDRAVGSSPASSAIVASVLASVGAPAQEFIEKRLADPARRDAMCRGLAASDASAPSRATFMRVPATSRDSTSCLLSASEIAQVDDAALPWLAATAEVGLLRAVGRERVVACDRLATIWKGALAARPAEAYQTLTVALAEAVKRCPRQLDPVLAGAFDKGPQIALIVSAVTPADRSTGELTTTCARLPLVLRSKLDPRLRERAADALAQGCVAPK